MEQSNQATIEQLEEALIRERLKLEDMVKSGMPSKNLGDIIAEIEKLEKAIEGKKQ
jgi:hypothetical protein